MTTLNNHPVIRRNNRPSAVDAVLLELYNSRAGQLADPYAVCSVHIFPDLYNGDSSYWLVNDQESENYGLVDQEKAHTNATMIFSTSSHVYPPDGEPGYILPGNPDSSGFSTTRYNPDEVQSASGIFKLSPGHLGVVLLAGAPIAGAWEGEDADFPDTGGPWEGSWNTNNTERVMDYFDIWTVRQGTSPKLTTFIHRFSMTTGGNVSFTEPLLLTTQHSLVQKYVPVNSIVKLQVNTDHTVNNKNISDDIKNIFRESVISDASMRIIRLADNTTDSVPYVVIKDWNDTRYSIGIDSSDTITYLWDTTEADTRAGTYQIQVESTVFDQTVRSGLFTLILR